MLLCILVVFYVKVGVKPGVVKFRDLVNSPIGETLITVVQKYQGVECVLLYVPVFRARHVHQTVLFHQRNPSKNTISLAYEENK